MRPCSSRLAPNFSFMKPVLGFAPVHVYTTSASSFMPFSVEWVPSADLITRSFSITCPAVASGKTKTQTRQDGTSGYAWLGRP